MTVAEVMRMKLELEGVITQANRVVCYKDTPEVQRVMNEIRANVPRWLDKFRVEEERMRHTDNHPQLVYHGEDDAA